MFLEREVQVVLPRKARVILEEATGEEASSLIFRSCCAGNFSLLGSLKTDPGKTRVTTLCIEGRPLGWPSCLVGNQTSC